MYKTTIKIDGMMCGMCESHICDALRKAFPEAKKVSASHSKKQGSFLSEPVIGEERIKQVIDETGYKYMSSTTEPYVKRGLFGGR